MPPLAAEAHEESTQGLRRLTLTSMADEPATGDSRARPSDSPWLVVDEPGLRARDADDSLLLPEQLFAVMILWDAAELDPGTWIGWLTTVNHRSARFCSADLREVSFQTWLERLDGWEPARLAHAIETPGLHLVWRRHLE